MRLGCIADDFTGASDLANTLTRGGLATTQFVGVPRGGRPANCEAGVVSLKIRSIARNEAVGQSLDAIRWLQAQNCSQFFFKYCSTFDSTPAGNIGPVAEAMLDALGAEIAVVCPVFPEAGRTLYQGHLFVNDRLLSESGMERHPLTPMTDPDIRRWLGRQTRGEVGLVPYDVVRQGPPAIKAALNNECSSGHRLVVVDAVTNADLRAIGTAVASHRLVTGGSGLAIGLSDNFRGGAGSEAAGRRFAGLPGAGIVLSGSCSTTSRAQLATYLQHHPGLAITADALMAGHITASDALSFARENRPRAPAIYSSADPQLVATAQNHYGRERMAQTIESFFGELARSLLADGVTRFAIGGGETSGAVVTALALDRLEVGPEIAPGVPALASESPGPIIRLALKSGNFGGPDFYEEALRVLEAT